jgi:hypothetical protein
VFVYYAIELDLLLWDKYDVPSLPRIVILYVDDIVLKENHRYRSKRESPQTLYYLINFFGETKLCLSLSEKPNLAQCLSTPE